MQASLPPARRRRSGLAATFAGCAAALSLLGCSAPAPPPVDMQKVQQFEARAYQPQQTATSLASEEVRTVDGQPLRLVWQRPQDTARHPLVVYMPGAGQDAHAQARWRRAVADAGYAVLSWQPLAEDERPPAPGADAHAWAVQRFSPPRRTERAAALEELMDGLARAQAAGDATLGGVDLSRVALAGYDLGAATALLVAGEQVRDASAGSGAAARFKAFVVISPHASFEQGGLTSRYRDVRGPLMSITSDADADNWGLGGTAYLRTAPFAGMSQGQKYLLLLQGASHAALGGDERPPGAGGEAASAARRGPVQAPADPQGGGSRRPGGRQGDRAGGGPGGREAAAPGSPGAAPSSLTAQALQRSALAAVSLAFLDAWLAEDPLARRWLADSAARWLQPVAELRSK